MVESLSIHLNRIDEWVWGLPLIILLVGTGIYFSILLRGMPFLRLPEALYLAFIRRKESGSPGDISHFQALMTALSATVGVGNIAGVATAISIGGPGAMVWMWLTGLVGMASKYAEAVLAIKFRKLNSRGEMSGGPMYYIEQGLHCRWLAIVFAICTSVAAFGIGNMVQSHSVAHGLSTTFGISPILSGVVMTFVSALVLLGGIQSIARAASVIAPVMILFYFIAGLIALIVQRGLLLSTLLEMFRGALSPPAAVGGFAGATLAQAMRIGIARGIFSNESGLGSSPIVAAAAMTSSPKQQALVSMSQTFIDTLVVCSITGLVIVSSGAWHSGATGSELTIQAFRHSLGSWGSWIVPIALVLFAYSTILGWSYYGEKAVEYLAGIKAIMPYRWIFCALVLVGALAKLEIVWSLADILNACMALPNLIALLALSPIVLAESRRHRASQK